MLMIVTNRWIVDQLIVCSNVQLNRIETLTIFKPNAECLLECAPQDFFFLLQRFAESVACPALLPAFKVSGLDVMLAIVLVLVMCMQEKFRKSFLSMFRFTAVSRFAAICL